MPNVHMQTAAKNLQQAVNDLRILQQQIRADADQHKREMQQRINDLRQEKMLIQNNLGNVRSDQERAIMITRMNKVDQDIKDLEKAIFDTEDEARKQHQNAENQVVQVDSISKQLTSMA